MGERSVKSAAFMPYSERYVAFIDILGFRETIKRSEADPRLYEALVKTLSEIHAREPFEGEETVDFQFQTFSDSIVISSAPSKKGLGYMLAAIHRLTLELMQESLLIRGGIAKGKLYHEKGVMFGPAVIEAYEIEKTIAKYPRVILSKQTYKDHRALELESSAVTLSEDGPPCLNIFGGLKFLLSKDDTRLEATEVATKCRAAIQSLLEESIHNPGHYEKLRWLAILWNSTRLFTEDSIIFPFAAEFIQRHQKSDKTQ
jgi:hypothetical protein